MAGKRREEGTHDDGGSDGGYSGYGSEGEHCGDWKSMGNPKSYKVAKVITLRSLICPVFPRQRGYRSGGLLLVAYVTTSHAREGSERVGQESGYRW